MGLRWADGFEGVGSVAAVMLSLRGSAGGIQEGVRRPAVSYSPTTTASAVDTPVCVRIRLRCRRYEVVVCKRVVECDRRADDLPVVLAASARRHGHVKEERGVHHVVDGAARDAERGAGRHVA